MRRLAGYTWKSLLLVVMGLLVLTSTVFADDASNLATVEVSEDGSSQQCASTDYSFDDFVRYAENDLTGMPDPEHMWDSEQSLLSVMASDPYWVDSNGVKSFYNGYGQLYASPAIFVIDVSHHQGEIDWNRVKQSGVDAVILRFGYGWGNLDGEFERNLSEVRRLGIPYGVYMYSYAYDAQTASYEAAWTAEVLDRYGTEGMQLPIYYDLENWGTWSEDGVTYHVPTSVSQYESIVDSYVSTLASRGYSDVNIYSYRSYLQTVLNSPSIWKITSWIAAYSTEVGIENQYYTGQYGWQYSSSGSVPGISGNVDCSAFSGFDYVNVGNLPIFSVEEGTYYLNSQLKDSSGVEIRDDSLVQGATTQLGSYRKSDSQRYQLLVQTDGSYVIQNTASGLVLDVQNGQAGNGAVVQQYPSNGTDAQRWFLRDAGNGYYIQSALGNWVLDVSGAATSDGTPITLYSPNGSDAQKFMVAGTKEVPVDTPQRISSGIDDTMVVDLSGASASNGASIQLYPWNESDAQLFYFREVGNGIYEIESAATGKVVEVSGGQITDGSKVAQYSRNGTKSQHWTVQFHQDSSVSFTNVNTGKALDVPNGIASQSTQLQIYKFNGSNAQNWFLTVGTTRRQRIDALAAEHLGTVKPGVYALGSALSERMVVDVSGGSNASGANVQLYESNASSAQRWSITEDSAGYLTITNVGSGKVLDVSGANATNGANVQQYADNNSYAQKWIAEKNEDGSITFCSGLDESLVLDVQWGGTSNETNIDIYSRNGTVAQQFDLYSRQPVSGEAASIQDGTRVFVSSVNSKVMDVSGASLSDGARLQLYPANDTPAQSFYLERCSNGLFSIRAVVSGKYLDAYKGDIVPGGSVSLWGNSPDAVTQRYWQLIEYGNNSYIIVNAANGFALGADSSLGLVTVPIGDKRLLTWSLDSSYYPTSIEELDKKAMDQGAVIPNGTYTITSGIGSRMVLDVSSGSLTNCANVQLYEANGSNAQKWTVENVGDGYIKLRNVGSNKYLDVDSGIVSSGRNVWQYENNDTRAQLWLPVKSRDGSFVLYSALGGALVLDVSGGSAINGANYQVFSANGTSAQTVRFVRAGV